MSDGHPLGSERAGRRPGSEAGAAVSDAIAVRTTRLSKTFPVRGTRGAGIRAVSDVDLQVDTGTIVGLVGESGSGKSTLARLITRLLPVTDGEIDLFGQRITRLGGSELRRVRRTMQMVFQDPYSSLDARVAVLDAIAEPLTIHRVGDRRTRLLRAAETMARVGISPENGRRYPHEFSGGQRQRIAIARALVLEPRLLVLDEPLSALDVSVQAQIVNLLLDLHENRGLTYLFISHDLAVVRHLATRVAVMFQGRIVEAGPAREVLSDPGHPYTQELLAAIPARHPRLRRTDSEGAARSEAGADVRATEGGCPFRLRCPIAQEMCRSVAPELVEGEHPGHPVACHFRT